MNKLKAFFSQFEKVAKEEKRPKRSVMQFKVVYRLFYGLAILFVGFVVLTFGRAVFLQSQVNVLEEKIMKFEEKIKQQDMNVGVDDHALLHYLTQFMKVYVNVPIPNEQRVGRQELLNKYYAKGVVVHAPKGDSERRLLDLKLIKVDALEKHLEGVFEVSYEITDPVMKERPIENGVEKYVDYVKKNVTSYLIVPFMKKDDKFQIIGEPRITTNPIISYQDTVTVDSVKNKVTDSELVSKLDTFLNNFMVKYHAGAMDDLAYLMETPVGLNKQMKVKELVKQEYEQLEGGLIKAYVTVDLVDSDTQFIKTERYILTLVKKDNVYLVRSIDY